MIPFGDQLIQLDNHEWRLYGDNMAQVYAVVDQDDYEYFSRWKWDYKISRGGKKIYLRRSAGNSTIKRSPIYLHVAICSRANFLPPSEEHTYVDHINGNSLDNRRDNLRWATPTQNRRNARRAGNVL